MLDPGSLVSGGGVAGLLLALAYFVQQFVKARLDTRAAGPALASSAVKDTASANAVLLASLQEERARIADLIAQLNTCHAERDGYREQVWRERAQYERTIRDLQDQLNRRD